MNLLTPAFLAGLAALAVPLLVHLIRRERDDAVEFPSLMFLSRIPQPTVKRRRIRNWWLFALRCLALILIAGAFARPFLVEEPGEARAADGSRDVVILLDRSYSMGYGDRWQRATAAARDAIGTLNEGDRASLVLFDAAARTAATATDGPAQLLAALDTTRPGSGVTRYSPALKLAQNILVASPHVRQEVVLISDFQRAGWDGGAGAQLPPGASLNTVDVGDDVASNVYVTQVTLQRARTAAAERVTPTVHIRNAAPSAVTVPVTLQLDGRDAQRVTVSVDAGASVTATLQAVTLPDEPVRAVIRAGDDPLAADNAFHLMLAPDPGVRVLVAEPASGDAGVFLRSALSLAEDPPFDVRAKRGGLPTSAELQQADVVVLDDVHVTGGDAGRRLADWVRAGGGLVIASGESSARGAWNDVASELAGAAPERVVDRTAAGGAHFGFIDYSHPVFESFRAPRGGAFSGARIFRYRSLAVPAAADSATSAVVLARHDDGSPALIERTVGLGRVLLWSTTLDADWTNLPLEPVYLPFVQQLVSRAAGSEPVRPWSVAGQVTDLGRDGAAGLLVNTPSGRNVRVDGSTLLVMDEPGFYQVRQSGASSRTTTHAVNLDVAESDLATFEPAELSRAVVLPGSSAGVTSVAPARGPEEMERHQALWWYLLLVVFGLLVAEAVFANRRSVRPA